MLIILPLIAFALCWLLLDQLSVEEHSWRDSFMRTSVLWGVYVTINTELLSLVSALNTPAIALTWLILITILAFLLYKHTPLLRTAFTVPNICSQLSKTDAMLILSTIGIIAIVGITALIAPPNTWDSMSYHMSRVAHWAQNRTVYFYPTSILRQLWMPPWAEYTIAQLQILSQGDRFANMIQWWSMTGSVLGVSLIAQLLGASRRGQILSAVICASLPVGILEGSSTQNDYTAAFWMVACMYFGLGLLKKASYSSALWCGLSLGLAILTKATAMILIPSFFIWISVESFQKYGKKFLSIAALLIIIPLALNFPQLARNYQLNGNNFSLTSESKNVANEKYTAQAIVSNALRYTGLNLAINSEPINKKIEKTIGWAHHQLNWDVIDVHYTFGDQYRVVYSQHEDSAGNTAATVTFFLTIILFLSRYRRLCSTDVFTYLLSWLSILLIFCLISKWQPWGNRLLLPLAVLATPFMGTVLSKINPRVNIAIAATLLILCLPWVFNNTSRPIISKDNSIFTKARNEQYFANTPGMYFSYQRAAEEIDKNGCKNIGLILGSNSWEYPLWPLWHAPQNKTMRIEHVQIDNPSKKLDYPLGNFDPCAILSDHAQEITDLTVNNNRYTKTDQWAFLSIFRKDPDGNIAKMVRNSYFTQMIESSMQSDLLMAQAQASGNLSQETMLQAFHLRQMAINEAKLLNITELDGLYHGLGSVIKDMFIRGNELFLEGLTTQDPAKINQGQNLLNQWNVWLQKNTDGLQKAFQ